jgi:hypothetical protein
MGWCAEQRRSVVVDADAMECEMGKFPSTLAEQERDDGVRALLA